jgi:hypothetical protein
LLLHALGQGVRLVDFVDRDNDGHVGGFGVIDGFQGLRHDAIVSGYHQHHDVRHLRSASTHAGESFVTRGIEEDDLAAEGRRVGIGDRNFVCADVLGDAASLAAGDVGGANGIEQAGLAVIDVAHDGDHRRTGDGLRSTVFACAFGRRLRPWPIALRR